jgi:hypothetical protein
MTFDIKYEVVKVHPLETRATGRTKKAIAFGNGLNSNPKIRCLLQSFDIHPESSFCIGVCYLFL